MIFRISFISAVMFVSCLAAAEATLTEAPVLASLVPFQQWGAKKATAQGALVADSVLGINMINWMRGVASTGLKNKFSGYRFLANEESPVVVYFPSDGRGFNFMKDWNVPATDNYQISVAQYSPQTPNEWGLHADVHFVQVEVNGGRGTPGDIHFVPSKTTVLDNDEKVIEPEKTLHKFLAPFAPKVGAQYAEVRDQLESTIQTEKAKNADYDWVRQHISRPSDRQGFSASWNAATREFSMMYYQRRNYIHSEETPSKNPNCYPIVTSQAYGAEYATRLTVSDLGPSQQLYVKARPYILAKHTSSERCRHH